MSPSTPVALSVVIPVYNEPANIPLAIEALAKVIPVPYEVLIVYDYDEDTTKKCVVGKGLAGTAGVALSPDGADVYIAASDSNALSTFTPAASSPTRTPWRPFGVGGGGRGTQRAAWQAASRWGLQPEFKWLNWKALRFLRATLDRAVKGEL